jgi:nucleoside-diphosphate-sugar epimerase
LFIEKQIVETGKKLAVLGAGWLGLPFCKAAHALGWDVAFTQTEASAAFHHHYERWHSLVYQLGQPFPDSFLEGAHRLVIALPPSLKGKTNHSLAPFEELAAWVGANVTCPVLILSSTGIYDGLQGLLSEENAPGPTLRAQHLFAIESAWAKHLSNFTIFRLGGLIGPNRHPGKWAAEKLEVDRPEDSLQVLHLHDAVMALMTWLHDPFPGTYNVVCDYRPNRLDFYKLWNPLIKSSTQQLPPSEALQRVCLNTKIKKAAHLVFKVNSPEDFVQNSV